MQAMPPINPRIVSLIVIRASFQGSGSPAGRSQQNDSRKPPPDGDLVLVPEFLASLDVSLVQNFQVDSLKKLPPLLLHLEGVYPWRESPV